MPAIKLTDSQLAERRKIVADALERNPALTVHHFHVAYGYNTVWLKSLGLKFGKHKPDPAKFGRTGNR